MTGNTLQLAIKHVLIAFLAFDLGLEFDKDDPTYVANAVKTIEDRFDLVMITDRFEESVILLKEYLCLSVEDVVYLK